MNGTRRQKSRPAGPGAAHHLTFITLLRTPASGALPWRVFHVNAPAISGGHDLRGSRGGAYLPTVSRALRCPLLHRQSRFQSLASKC